MQQREYERHDHTSPVHLTISDCSGAIRLTRPSLVSPAPSPCSALETPVRRVKLGELLPQEVAGQDHAAIREVDLVGLARNG